MAPSPADAPDSAAVLESMTLLASLSTAADLHEAVRERRRGRDPAAQAPTDIVAARLEKTRATLEDLLMQLMLGHASLDPEGSPTPALAVRTFDLLMKVRRVERLLKMMHQHLLSLYPEVSEQLVEEARHTHDEAATVLAWTSSGPLSAPLSDLVERGLSLVAWTRREVSS